MPADVRLESLGPALRRRARRGDRADRPRGGAVRRFLEAPRALAGVRRIAPGRRVPRRTWCARRCARASTAASAVTSRWRRRSWWWPRSCSTSRRAAPDAARGGGGRGRLRRAPGSSAATRRPTSPSWSGARGAGPGGRGGGGRRERSRGRRTRAVRRSVVAGGRAIARGGGRASASGPPAQGVDVRLSARGRGGRRASSDRRSSRGPRSEWCWSACIVSRASGRRRRAGRGSGRWRGR